MFETAELGHKIAKEEFKAQVPDLRRSLLSAQAQLMQERYPVILLFGGVDGGGKGESANLLLEWMDPRFIRTHAYGVPSQEARARPSFWRYWRELPPKGTLGIFLSAWYSAPLLDRVYGNIGEDEFDEQLDRILNFERMLAEDGALIVKLWMHLGKDAQKARFEALEDDPAQAWRITERDWKHYEMRDKFVSAAEHLIMRTSIGRAPWHIIDGSDHRYRSLKMGTILLDAMTRRFRQEVAKVAPEAATPDGVEEDGLHGVLEAVDRQHTVLSQLDMSKSLEKSEYTKRLKDGHARLNRLHRRAKEEGVTTLMVFEGWDAGGKGGAIRRTTAALDARDYEVISIAAPTDEENAHHYLWRFWRHMPRAGRMTIFDRSWYGRVLVERVEGFAQEPEWRRAYAEINDFEQQLVDHGIVLLKFWLHITPDEQAQRFESRRETPHKAWKLTDEDWRNRERWDDYELAVNEMVERCSTEIAPWLIVEGNDKRYARVRVLEAVCDALEKRLGSDGDRNASKKRKKKKKDDQ